MEEFRAGASVLNFLQEQLAAQRNPESYEAQDDDKKESC